MRLDRYGYRDADAEWINVIRKRGILYSEHPRTGETAILSVCRIGEAGGGLCDDERTGIIKHPEGAERYEEASDALLELKSLNPLAAEDYCRRTLQNEAGDIYYRAIVLDTSYSPQQELWFRALCLRTRVSLPDYVLAAASLNVELWMRASCPDAEDLRAFRCPTMLSYIEQKSLELQDLFRSSRRRSSKESADPIKKCPLYRKKAESLSLESVLGIVLGEPGDFTKAYKSYPGTMPCMAMRSPVPEQCSRDHHHKLLWA